MQVEKMLLGLLQVVFVSSRDKKIAKPTIIIWITKATVVLENSLMSLTHYTPKLPSFRNRSFDLVSI